MKRTLEYRFRVAFTILQIVALCVGAFLAFLSWKAVQHAQSIQSVFWHTADVAMELRIGFLEAERRMALLHWADFPAVDESEKLSAQYASALQILENSKIIEKEKLRRLDSLVEIYLQQRNAMLSLIESLDVLRIDPVFRTAQQHQDHMLKVISTSRELGVLLSEIEGVADDAMNKQVHQISLFTNISVAGLIVMAVSMLGLTGYFRRYGQQYVIRPIEQMVADIECLKTCLECRVRIPEVPELRVLATALNQALDQLEKNKEERRQIDRHIVQTERMASVGIVASGIVHNLRGPLTVIYGNGQLLEMANPELEDAKKIVESAQQMNRMIEGILDQGRQRKMLEPLDLNVIIERELDFLQADMFFKHEVEKDIRLSQDIPSLKGIYTDFSQIFGNLFRNAIDAMRRRDIKRLTVVTKHEEEHVIVEVTDTGCGISEDNFTHLFEPFFTTKTSDSQDTGLVGTGLGLYTIRQLLDLYDGEIEVKSAVDMGTTFKVKIPMD